MTPVTLAVFLLGLGVIVATSIFVAVPLFRAGDAAGPAEEASEHERWERQKRQALAAIKEAEDDHRMGKLSDDDLAAMRTRFEAQALEAMAALERGSRT
jgi:hypothetical protein